jgi:hypothetical protein
VFEEKKGRKRNQEKKEVIIGREKEKNVKKSDDLDI